MIVDPSLLLAAYCAGGGNGTGAPSIWDCGGGWSAPGLASRSGQSFAACVVAPISGEPRYSICLCVGARVGACVCGGTLIGAIVSVCGGGCVCVCI